MAFVRYASVYRDFREAEDFNRFVDEELGALKERIAERSLLNNDIGDD